MPGPIVVKHTHRLTVLFASVCHACTAVLLVAFLAGGCSKGPDLSNGETWSHEAFDRQVKESSIPVLVDFWAAWCGPCVAMHPDIEALKKERDGRLAVIKVNVDANAELAERFKVQYLPTLILFSNGQAVAMQEGRLRKRDLEQWIDKHVEAPDGEGKS